MVKDFRKELVVLKALNVKPNYAELGRIYNKDPRTIKKCIIIKSIFYLNT